MGNAIPSNMIPGTDPCAKATENLKKVQSELEAAQKVVDECASKQQQQQQSQPATIGGKSKKKRPKKRKGTGRKR